MAAEEVFDVVVVGAGAAGIAAARSLRQRRRGVLRCVVLEARNRVGGRVCTVPLCGVGVDVGASWIHQYSDMNPVKALVEELGVALFQPKRGRHVSFDGVTGRQWSLLASRETDKACRACFAALSAAQHKRSIVVNAKTGVEESTSAVAAAVAFRQVAEEWCVRGTCGAMVASAPDLHSEAARRRALAWKMGNHEQYEGAAMVDMSLQHWDSGGELPGHNAIPQGGYGGLLQRAARHLDVRLGHAVRSISTDAATGLHTVTCNVTDGTTATFYARHVIVAVPLGVLKAGVIQFKPALPEAKCRAIQRLGCAVMNKIVLAFERRFWGDGVSVIGVADAIRREFPWFLDLCPAFGTPTDTPILMCFLSTARSAELEALSDGDILAGCLKPLARCFVRGGGRVAGGAGGAGAGRAGAGAGGAGAGAGGAAAGAGGAGAGVGGAGAGAGKAGAGAAAAGATIGVGVGTTTTTTTTTTTREGCVKVEDARIAGAVETYGLPKLRGYIITRWVHDPCARGSWTFFPPGSSPQDYHDLAEPMMKRRLFFAGEHTCLRAQGCAHGAYMSGQAAAAQVAHASNKSRTR